MPTLLRAASLPIVAAALLSGCANKQLTPVFHPADITFTVGNSVPAKLSEVDLSTLVSPGSKTVDEALRNFRQRCAGSDGCRYERNSIQDRLIAASNSICKDYKSQLKQEQANTNLNFGGAATILGGLGAIAQSASPARLYSGAAAMASGLRAEVNQNVYAMLAVEVITKAIDKTRSEQLAAITQQQRQIPLNYTLERAIADAVEYHSRCSVLSGLQEAASAVSQSENLGIRTLSQTLADLNQTATIQLGKKNFISNSADVVQLRSVCSLSKQKYDNFVRDQGIDTGKAEYVSIAANWTQILSDASYCKGLGGPAESDAAALIDKRWQDLFDEYTRQTDDRERERVAGLIGAQQAAARAVANSLQQTLEDIIARLSAASVRERIARQAVARLRPVGSIDNGASDDEVRAAHDELTALKPLISDALLKVQATKSTLSTVQAQAILDSLAKIPAANDGLITVKAAVDAVNAALPPLSGWVPT